MKEAEANRLIDQFLVYKDEKKKEVNYLINSQIIKLTFLIIKTKRN